MESASTPEALVRPWRTATLVACSVAALELVLLLAIGIIVLGRPLLDHAQASAKRSAQGHKSKKVTAPSEPARRPERLGPPQLTRARTEVIVLNGNGVTGAAAAEATAIRARGYRVKAVGNARRSSYARSVVVYRPGFKPEAARLARDVGIGKVSPLDGMHRSDLAGAHVAVIVG